MIAPMFLWRSHMFRKIRLGIFLFDSFIVVLIYLLSQTTIPVIDAQSFFRYSFVLMFIYTCLRGFDIQRIASPRWTMTSFSIALFLSLIFNTILSVIFKKPLYMNAWGLILYYIVILTLFNPLIFRILSKRRKFKISVPASISKTLFEDLNPYTLSITQIEEKEGLKKDLRFYKKISTLLGQLPPGLYNTMNGEILDEVVKSKRMTSFVIRLLDILLSVFFILLLSPFLLLCTLALLLFQGKPVVYKQRRIGQRGKAFTLYKFRTLRTGEAKVTNVQEDHKDRSTGIGRFLRSLRLDELPQLFNCLKGDMSIIGPRPEMVYFHEMCQEEIPNYNKRLLVKPGISGWAQTMYKRSDTLEEYRIKTGYDLYFVLNYSLGMYFKSMLYTLDTLVYRKE